MSQFRIHIKAEQGRSFASGYFTTQNLTKKLIVFQDTIQELEKSLLTAFGMIPPQISAGINKTQHFCHSFKIYSLNEKEKTQPAKQKPHQKNPFNLEGFCSISWVALVREKIKCQLQYP